MSQGNTQGIRISLPIETKISSERETYTVKKYICTSSRSITVLCETSNGVICRLKLFNGKNCINNKIQKKIMSVSTQGIVLPVDIGEYEGCSFSVYPQINTTSTKDYPVSQQVLIQKVIPQVSYVINLFHKNRVLLRDISPDNILYKVKEGQIAYCGFSNMAILPDKVTITKEKGFGQPISFIAPEVPKYGYSTCSDYYSLGVTLLSLILGKNPMENMSWDIIQKNLENGKVPGIDINHLRNTPYNLYTEEDKVLYLILGLMLPNPKDRWGYGEVRCWINNQHIPLVRKHGKIVYQYNEPFEVDNKALWNYKDLSQGIAAHRNAWKNTTFEQLDQFARRQNILTWNTILVECNKTSQTSNSRIFKSIYGINPALDGFWWEGKKFADANALVKEAQTSQNLKKSLAEILRSRCFSYFLRMRKKVTNISENEISEIEQIEQWEIDEPGKGVNRCLMRFSRSMQTRSFWIDGKEYHNLEELVKLYCNTGIKLKNMSTDILRNSSFQAWLWANGMDVAGEEAKRIANTLPENSFFFLLKIAENSCKSENAKRMMRKMYLTYGEYAPIYWLANKIRDYQMVSTLDTILYDTFRNANISSADSIERLSSKLNNMVLDYQKFVARTAKSTMEVECIDPEYLQFSFLPLKEDGFFCCTWDNNLETSPAFFRAVGKPMERREIETWVNNSKITVQSKLDEVISNIPTIGNDWGDKAEYLSKCNACIIATVCMIVILIAFFLPTLKLHEIPFVIYILALSYPIYMFCLYYRKKAMANFYFDKKDKIHDRYSFYQCKKNSLDNVGNEMVGRICENQTRILNPFQEPVDTITDSETMIETLALNRSLSLWGLVSAISIVIFFYLETGRSVAEITISLILVYLTFANGQNNTYDWIVKVGILMIPLFFQFQGVGSFGIFLLVCVCGFIVFCKN